jgi:hypothetical protein
MISLRAGLEPAPSHTHQLSDLVGVAGLKQKLIEQESHDENFKLNSVDLS